MSGRLLALLAKELADLRRNPGVFMPAVRISPAGVQRPVLTGQAAGCARKPFEGNVARRRNRMADQLFQSVNDLLDWRISPKTRISAG